MKEFTKSLLNLQLFADDGENQDNQSQEPAKEEKQPSNGKESKAEDKHSDKKYSDDDVDRILNKKFAEWQKNQQKKVDEVEKLATMNAQEKAEYEAKKYKAELDELKRKNALSEMSKQARKMLDEEDIKVSDELLDLLVHEDAEKTKGAVNAFSKAFKEAVQQEIKEKLKGTSPKKSGVQNGALTRESIMAIKNPAERKRLIAENMDLFE